MNAKKREAVDSALKNGLPIFLSQEFLDPFFDALQL
jgi:hypothetical protein